MELRLSEGKYVCDDRGIPISDSGDQEIVDRVLFKLTARQGEFPFLPNLGSRLYKLPFEKSANLRNVAYQYVLEAIDDETEVQVQDVKLEVLDDSIDLTVILIRNDDSIRINLTV